MSFQAYLDNIEAKTGKSPQHFIDEAIQKGFSKNTKAGEMILWLADDYNLGRGHAMALIHVIKNGAKIADTHVKSNGRHNDPSNTLKLDGADTLSLIGSPARNALREIGVTNVDQLANHTEKELLAIHGIGPKAIRILKEASVDLKDV